MVAGPVARGGLRWSDRREDFRTEILGLVKALLGLFALGDLPLRLFVELGALGLIRHPDDPRVEEPARRNRQLLKSVLESVGMENYPYEWWHFTLVDEPFTDTYFDFPVSRGSLRG